MSLAVGIDLGTTYSALARVDEEGRPQLVANAEGKATTPSVVGFQGGHILVGDAAKELQALGSRSIVAYFKRQMGDPQFLFQVEGTDYTAVDLSALVLRKLKADAEALLGEPITRAVITVPAYFRNAERLATIEAGTQAGLEVIQVINEPTAAAVAYGFDRQEVGRRLVVYDLGGGTFDVTVLELTSKGVRVLSSDGDHQLGGKDWDDRIVTWLASQFEAEFGMDPLAEAVTVADLLHQAEEAKLRLSTLESTPLTLTYRGHRGRYLLRRSVFEELTADLMAQTASFVKRVLEDLHLGPEAIDGVLMVGGSTRMPVVRRYLEAAFGRPPLSGINPDQAVALGAALVAAAAPPKAGILCPPAAHALRGAIVVADVTNHSLGMIALNASKTAYVNSIILPKNRAIPCQESRPYQHHTQAHGENVIEVFMTQGETEVPAEAAYAGKFVIHGVPHRATGVTVVDITYRYGSSGTLGVTAKAHGFPDELKVTAEPLSQDMQARFKAPPGADEGRRLQHITAYLAIDLSGSMSGAPLKEAKRAALEFLRKSDLAHCSLGVIAFSDQVATKLEAIQNALAIERAIQGLHACETGVCNAAQPFDEALALLAPVEGRRVLVTLTDGMWANPELAVRRARVCHDASIEIIAVGFGSANREFLESIASSDEASFLTAMDGLVATFTTIAQELAATGSLTRNRSAEMPSTLPRPSP